jgi:hypothetical protein
MQAIKMHFIDTDDDHVDRGHVDIKYVMEMVDRACAHSNGTIVLIPHFEQRQHNEQYDRCICGKEIKYNFVAHCLETDKCFVVGSECIETVCLKKNIALQNLCRMCNNKHTKTLTMKYCDNCRSLRRRGGRQLGFGSKYAEQTFMEVAIGDRKYCEWVCENVKGKKMKTFADWYEAVADCQLEPVGDSDSSNDEGPALSIPKKVYLHIKYEEKDTYKPYGIRFDGERKQWYIFTDAPQYSTLIAKLGASRVLV